MMEFQACSYQLPVFFNPSQGRTSCLMKQGDAGRLSHGARKDADAPAVCPWLRQWKLRQRGCFPSIPCIFTCTASDRPLKVYCSQEKTEAGI